MRALLIVAGVLASLACSETPQRPSFIEPCSPAARAVDSVAVRRAIAMSAPLNSLCGTKAWRVVAWEPGTFGDGRIFSGTIGSDGTIVRWWYVRASEVRDSGLFRLPQDADREIREFIAGPHLRADPEPGVTCLDCGFVAGGLAADSVVSWFLRDGTAGRSRRVRSMLNRLGRDARAIDSLRARDSLRRGSAS